MRDCLCSFNDLQPGMVAVVGMPLDANASFRRGAAAGPSRIVEALFSESGNLFAENGLDLGASNRWSNTGDLFFKGETRPFETIERMAEELLGQGIRMVSLGGDHSITGPIVRAYSKTYPRLNILQMDAHPDLYDDMDGNPDSHASPFARIMEAGLVERLVQVGIRAMTLHQREQADRFGVEVYEMRHFNPAAEILFQDPVYLSIDLDCLDPAHAPGVSHHEPGGLATREVIQIIQKVRANIVGADIVELNPDRDWMDMTAMAAAKLLKEILSRMLD